MAKKPPRRTSPAPAFAPARTPAPAPTAPIIVIVGQTASGKSALALRAARQFAGEIIAADSRTIYKGMDIGTAKPSAQDVREVPHHGLDLIEPDQYFSAAAFQNYARTKVAGIHSRGKLPIIVGGTGLYVDGFVYDFSFAGEARSGNVQPQRRPKPKNILLLGLRIDREQLKERISTRVDTMFASGFLDEVQNVINAYGADAPGLLAPGYKAASKHLAGEINLQEAKELFIRNDKHLAKRQQTWFKRNHDIIWVQSGDEAMEYILNFTQV